MNFFDSIYYAEYKAQAAIVACFDCSHKPVSPVSLPNNWVNCLSPYFRYRFAGIGRYTTMEEDNGNEDKEAEDFFHSPPSLTRW